MIKKYILTAMCLLLCIQTSCTQTEPDTPSLPETPSPTAVIQESESSQETTQTVEFSEKTILEQKKEFEGEWKRTEVPRSFPGRLTIKEVDEEGFDFELLCMYYSHNGEIHERADFESATRAVCRTDEVFGDELAVICFELKDGKVVVTVEQGMLPFGANVTADGTYVKGEPVYTNGNILSETFSEEELQLIETTIADDEVYEEYFKFCVEYGVISVGECLVDGTIPARRIDGFVPTMGGYDFEMIITETGEVYLSFGNGRIPFKTNVAGAVDFPE